MSPILHPDLPWKVWMDPALARLPGVMPMGPQDWVLRDAAYAPQMAERARLIGSVPDRVHALLPQAPAAASELYDLIAARLPDLGFARSGPVWTCPDGRQVRVDPENPLLTLGLLVQPDLCLLQPGGAGEHVLTGAILCFPASWTLGEKIGRPLLRIHAPVASYDATMARRVQRLFDAIRPGAPLMRGNALAYADPTLHQPRPEGAPRVPPVGPPAYIRAERQCLIRLPVSGAVVFSIQTYVVDRSVLSRAEAQAFADWRAAAEAAHREPDQRASTS
jgi:dimethylamine monooxygenase subunit A